MMQIPAAGIDISFQMRARTTKPVLNSFCSFHHSISHTLVPLLQLCWAGCQPGPVLQLSASLCNFDHHTAAPYFCRLKRTLIAREKGRGTIDLSTEQIRVRGRFEYGEIYLASPAEEGPRGYITRVEGVDSMKGVGNWHAPPPSASWDENTTITECTQESAHLQSCLTFLYFQAKNLSVSHREGSSFSQAVIIFRFLSEVNTFKFKWPIGSEK